MTFTGQVPDGTVHMQLMDVMANASDHEPFGIVLLEAMALGVPVVAVAAGGPAEIIEDGVVGPARAVPAARSSRRRVRAHRGIRRCASGSPRVAAARSRSASRPLGWSSSSRPRSSALDADAGGERGWPVMRRRLPTRAGFAVWRDTTRLRLEQRLQRPIRGVSCGSTTTTPASRELRDRYGGRPSRASWLGVPTWKLPSDMWVYQELLVETRPELIVETGTQYGGSALFYASVFDLLGAGEVVTIDIDTSQVHEAVRAHPRMTVVEGSSTDPAVIAVASVRNGKRTMLILDSDHQQAHVAEELRTWSDLVSPGCYLVVEDTALGTQYLPGWGGSLAALEEWLPGHPEFQARSRAARSSSPPSTPAATCPLP